MGIPPLDAPEVQQLSIREAIQPQLARLLLLVAAATDAKMQLAIGGAVAARDAGWRRYTDDLDVFARPASAKRLLKALAAAGMKTLWITDAHGVAWLAEDNPTKAEAPSVRVDVLSTVTEPEASAIRTAVPPRSLGVPVKVFRPDHLAAIKFLAGRPQDLVDFDELMRRGVDLERVRPIVASSDESRVAAVTSRARRALKPPGLRESRAPYLSRAALDEAWKAAAVTPPSAPPGRPSRRP